MPIPNDHLQRSWIEVAATNPSLVANLCPSLLAFMAVGPGRVASFAGTGFIIDGSPEFAAVLTAKHVLTEGIARLQRPTSHAPSALFVPVSANRPYLDPEKLKVCWMGSQHANMMNVAHVSYNDALDIACCVITPQDQYAHPFRPVSIPIDTAVPKIGEVVQMISLDNMLVDELVAPADAEGIGQVISLHRRVSIRLGTVTGVYPEGFRQYRWPCFTSSIPAEPGMSGGFVFLPRDGKTISACGLVCADNSPSEARSNQDQSGESVIACAWPALALHLPEAIPSAPDRPTHSLYQFMRDGRVAEAIGGIGQIEVVERGGGNLTTALR
jgi:hypothetical protein